MNIESAAALATAHSQQKANTQVATAVLKKTLEIAESSAAQLLSALPATPPAPAVGSTSGGHINTSA